MKYIITLLSFVTAVQIQAQDHISPLKINDDNILYIDQIYQDSTTSSTDLFSRSKVWIAKAFADGKDVDIHSDKETGVIIGKGSVKFETGLSAFTQGNEYVGYTINIYVKEGKAKIVLDNLYSQEFGNSFSSTKRKPFEKNYFTKKGKPNKTLKKYKKNRVKHLQSVIDSWADSVSSESSYSDF